MKKRILLVDDDKDIIFKFKNLLEEAGLYVDAYTDPYLVLLEFNPELYDLLLVAIRMSDMNGFELAQVIKSRDKKIKVCFITTFEPYYTFLAESFPNLDFKCFIRKPIPGKELVEKIRIVLSS